MIHRGKTVVIGRRHCQFSREVSKDLGFTYNISMDTVQHIIATPGTCSGKPRIAGTRIRVQDVAVWHKQLQQTPEEIVHEFPQLTLADVYAALAYYYDHQAEIEEQMEAGIRLVEELKATLPTTRRFPPGEEAQ
jgi:uncharacterized protein (DUF433 family)